MIWGFQKNKVYISWGFQSTYIGSYEIDSVKNPQNLLAYWHTTY